MMSQKPGISHICPWVERFAHLIPQGEVLDLACGGGRHGRYFLNKGLSVTFLDRDVSGVEDLADHPLAQVVEFDLEAGRPWPFAAEKFSAVVVVNYLHRPLLPYLFESLKEGGVLLYHTFADGNQMYGRPSNPDFLLQQNELLNAYGKDMQVIDFIQGYSPSPPSVTQSICAIKRS